MAAMVLKSVRLFVGLILVCFFYSCNSRENSKDSALLYWSANNPYEIEFAEMVVNKWNKAYPERPVRFQPVPEGRSSEEFILAAVVGKTTPDMYSNMWQGDVETYARAGVLIPLDTLDGFMDYMYQRCDSSVLEEVTSGDGHIYQIPWKINPIMLLYNKGIMESVGFTDPPETYSEFISAASKIVKNVDGDGYVDRWVGYSNVLVTWLQRLFDFYSLYLGASGGGKLVEGDSIVFNNKAAIETFRFLQKMYANNYFSKELLSARQDVFLSEIIATRFTGPWEIIHTEKFKPKGFRYGFSHLPVPDDHVGDVYTYGDPKNMVIFNTCQDPQRAWEFLRFVINKENDLEFLMITTQLPRRKNIFEDPFFSEYFKNNPRMIPFAKQSKFVRGTDPCPVLKEIFDVISREYEACVIYSVKTPEQAIADAAKWAQLLLD
jgi:multiple sugar transport system substrate-binding protein